MNLIDAISINTSVDSPVALRGNPVFNRQYGSLHDAVDNFDALVKSRTSDGFVKSSQARRSNPEE